MGVLERLTGLFGPVKAAPEGAYRDGPWLTTQGWLPHAWGQYVNFWQMGYDPIGSGTSAMVEACVSAYAQTTAMCPFGHWRELENGGRERVTTSALSRIQRAPNDYQTRSDFLLNLVRSLYLDGNAYALALRNERFEIASLHLMHPRHSFGQEAGGEVFYALGGNNVIEGRLEALELDPELLKAVPARDVLHVKLHTPTGNVLKGETPLTAASLAVASTNAAMMQSAQFYANQSRPSGVLQTDLVMTDAQNESLRKKWDEQSKGLGSGGVPILTAGLKFNPITVSPKDAQFAESMKMSDAQIAQVFRVPPAIVGAESQPMASTEAAMNWWIAGGLGFCLNQVELAFDRTFGLDRGNGEYSELDSSVLLRSAFKERIEGLVRAVQGGVFSPNEARALESMPAKKGGAEPRVQQQLVPLSFAIEPPAPPAPPAAPPAPPDPDADEPEDEAPPKMTVTDWNRYFEGASA
jgi:HK97 family phage portal protein